MSQSQQLLKIPCEFCAAPQSESLAGTSRWDQSFSVSGVRTSQDGHHQSQTGDDLMHVGVDTSRSEVCRPRSLLLNKAVFVFIF